jgi:hypothetical protein
MKNILNIKPIFSKRTWCSSVNVAGNIVNINISKSDSKYLLKLFVF